MACNGVPGQTWGYPSGALQLGQQEQARRELSTVIELYRAMEMTFWLPGAEAVLTQM
jgi:hypothetical protein